MSTLREWDSDPVAVFAEFVLSEDFAKTSSRLGEADPMPISKKSAAVYRFMFRKFANWLKAEKKVFTHAGEQDLVRFVSQIRRRGEQSSLITRRYLRLLERCYTHLQVAPNPATSATKLAVANQYIGKDEGTEALSPEQIDAFVAALPPFDPALPNRAGRLPKAWKRRRDHAMQATILFSGLRVAEAIGLHLDEVDDPFKDGPIRLQIQPDDKHDTSYEHETVVQEYGAEALRRWLIERQSLDVGGDLVFPGDRTGKPMTRLTVYRQVKATFARAGIEVNRSGGRTLRNTFAAGELKRGRTKADLKESLGLALERSAGIYEHAKPRKSPVDEGI